MSENRQFLLCAVNTNPVHVEVNGRIKAGLQHASEAKTTTVAGCGQLHTVDDSLLSTNVTRCASQTAAV